MERGNVFSVKVILAYGLRKRSHASVPPALRRYSVLWRSRIFTVAPGGRPSALFVSIHRGQTEDAEMKLRVHPVSLAASRIQSFLS